MHYAQNDITGKVAVVYKSRIMDTTNYKVRESQDKSLPYFVCLGKQKKNKTYFATIDDGFEFCVKNIGYVLHGYGIQIHPTVGGSPRNTFRKPRY